MRKTTALIAAALLAFATPAIAKKGGEPDCRWYVQVGPFYVCLAP